MHDPNANKPLDEDAVLRAIVEGVEADTGDEFFVALVRHLAVALGVQYAFVSEFTDDGRHFRTKAVWARGAPGENFAVPIDGTPCATVLDGRMSHHPDHLQELFPNDRGLVTWGARSYCGVPLLDRGGVVMGHLAIMDDQPMLDGPRGLAILRIFAARACAELERLRADADLRESEARYRDLYEEAPIAYMSIGLDGRIRRANRQAGELFGRPLDALIGTPVFDLAADTPDGRPRSRRAYERFLAGLETIGEEVQYRRADGTPVWVRLSVRPMRDAAGKIVATRSLLVDITERKRIEEALRVSEERLARVLDSAMDAIVTLDEERRVELFNDAAERAFHCPAAEALGRPFDRFLTDGFRDALAEGMASLRRGAPTTPYIWAPQGLCARDLDGREFAIEATISHVEVHGRSLYTLILRDVEQRRQAEDALRVLHRQNAYLQEEIRAVHNVGEIVGASARLQDVLDKVRLVAPTDSSVLILGETGTGKELIARAVHSASRRREFPLVKVNCAALPTGLIESELFGHEKGAFTGAHERRLGRFELADGGTIFLDEIGEMPPDVQVKLLRVLQEHELERVGGSAVIKVDVRVIAATNRDLAKVVAEGTFRSDLFYRLNVFPVHLPPLRARVEDVPALVHYFAARYAAKIGRRIERIPRDTMERLASYGWPGNVRELENVIERAVILSPGPDLTVSSELLPTPAPSLLPAAPAETAAASVAAAGGATSLEEMERVHIIGVLKQTNWRIEGPTGAARLLDMNPSTLRSRMKRLGIQRSFADIS